MEQLYPDLWRTRAERPLAPFPKTLTHAYVLKRPAGNVMVYAPGREAVGTPDITADLDAIEAMGGLSHILLGHWHEASPGLKAVKERFGATIVAHARDAAMIGRESGVEPDTVFWDRHEVLPGIEAIPTPGHTVGSACYLVRSQMGKTYLFTGDTIWPARGSFTSVTFEDDGKQSNHRSSLDILAQLKPDIVIGAVSPDDTAVEIDPNDWPRFVEDVKGRLG